MLNLIQIKTHSNQEITMILLKPTQKVPPCCISHIITVKYKDNLNQIDEIKFTVAPHSKNPAPLDLENNELRKKIARGLGLRSTKQIIKITQTRVGKLI